MPLKDAKKRRKYYMDNKERMSEKNMEAIKKTWRTPTKASYDKDPDSSAKSTARSKASYDKDLPKSHEDSAACSKASYDELLDVCLPVHISHALYL